MAQLPEGINFLEPVSELRHRPQWSVMIPVYNNAPLLRQTLQSVLEQAFPEEDMQIMVLDDCSTDHPEQVVQELGKGRVQFFRQPENVGHRKNFEEALRRATGTWIHLLHGDDYVLPGFYAAFTKLFREYPQLMAAFCRHDFVNEHNRHLFRSNLLQEASGPVLDFFDRIAEQQLIQTPSIVVQRSVYEQIGMFHPQLSWCEDWEMWARTGLHFAVGYIPETLACYRMHSNSNSGRYSTTAENIRDLKRAIKIITGYISDSEKRKQVQQLALSTYARYAMGLARQMISQGNSTGARNQLREALFMNPDWLFNLKLIAWYLVSFASRPAKQ